MSSITEQLILLATAWFIYFSLHSITASLSVKDWLAKSRPNWMPGYRLGFNFLAIILLTVPLYLTLKYPGSTVWQWNGYHKVVTTLLTYSSIAGFIWSLKYYDGLEFLGIRQLRSQEKSVEDQEHFQLSPFHRYVRHPWYFFALVYIWTQDMSSAWLLSSTMMTLYFIIGSRLEERKLVVYHGEIYRQYLKKVPGLFPLPWRYLSNKEAYELIENYHP